jgi:hypothetical protein
MLSNSRHHRADGKHCRTLCARLCFGKIPVSRRERSYIVNFAAGLLALAVTFGLILLIRSFYEQTSRNFASHRAPLLSPVEVPGRRQLALVPWSQLSSKLDSESNVLELPKASFDFVGSWGGYTHDTAPSEVESPDHVSVVFGRRGDTVFFATKLYSPSSQKIVSKPRAWITNAKEVFVTYKAEDEQLDYAYLHRFTLLESGKIAYKETVKLYDRRTQSAVGTAGQHALLSRLTTTLEMRVFAQPSSRDVFKSELSSSKKIHAR